MTDILTFVLLLSCLFQVLVSDANEPGEGEHKIMRLIRQLRQQPNYNPNTRHTIYGQDADLLLLALLCHEPHVKVLRENMHGAVSDPGGRGKGR